MLHGDGMSVKAVGDVFSRAGFGLSKSTLYSYINDVTGGGTPMSQEKSTGRAALLTQYQKDVMAGLILEREPARQQSEAVKQLVKVPFHAGWSIVAVKNANWRYWTLVLRNPQTETLEDFFLVSVVGGGGGKATPFLLAPLCVECGIKATHLCGSCLSVGFCIDHGQENAHRERECVGR